MTKMLKFHCCIHRAPKAPVSKTSVVVNGSRVETIVIDRPLRPLPISFEEAADELSSVDGLHFELDGWFVWGVGVGDVRWQVDGQLADGGSQLEYVELRGRCPREAFDQLLDAFGAKSSTLAIQMVQQGVFVNVETFKQCAAISGNRA